MALIKASTDEFWNSMEDWALKTGNAIAGVIGQMIALKNMGGMSWEDIVLKFFPNAGFHEGGIVEEHHDGEFAGNLKSNEVFAKLLKGELVSTEGQMDNFMKSTLPKLMGSAPSTARASNSIGNITLSMPITVQGNLDSSVMPDLNKLSEQMIKKLNDTLVSRGYIRTVNQTIS